MRAPFVTFALTLFAMPAWAETPAAADVDDAVVDAFDGLGAVRLDAPKPSNEVKSSRRGSGGSRKPTGGKPSGGRPSGGKPSGGGERGGGERSGGERSGGERGERSGGERGTPRDGGDRRPDDTGGDPRGGRRPDEGTRPDSRDSGSRGDDARGARPESAERRGESGRPDGDRANGPARGAHTAPYDADARVRPDGGRPDAGRDARPTTVTRSVRTGDGARADARMPEGRRPDRAVAPANYRGSRRDSDHGRAGSVPPPRGRDGRDGRPPERALSPQERDRARDVVAAHRHAAWARDSRARHHAAWAARHRPYRWYQPRGWFRPWHPGYRPVWYHGVFVYGPPPWHHHDHVVVVHDGDGGGGGSRSGGGGRAAEPKRAVDRKGSLAIGLRGGSYLGAYDLGEPFGDAGLGLALRYRPVEAVGLELSWQHHDQTWDEGSERVHEPVQASVQLFAAPWTKVNPYVLTGVTFTGRSIDDKIGPYQAETDKTVWGPHLGVGMEFGLAKKASINFDVRWIGYLNSPADDLTRPGAATANMGLNFYF